MARKFSGVDTKPWKLMQGNKAVKVVNADTGIREVATFKGFKDAAKAAFKLGGVPVRT